MNSIVLSTDLRVDEGQIADKKPNEDSIDWFRPTFATLQFTVSIRTSSISSIPSLPRSSLLSSLLHFLLRNLLLSFPPSTSPSVCNSLKILSAREDDDTYR